jgi:hypothetical protein
VGGAAATITSSRHRARIGKKASGFQEIPGAARTCLALWTGVTGHPLAEGKTMSIAKLAKMAAYAKAP